MTASLSYLGLSLLDFIQHFKNFTRHLIAMDEGNFLVGRDPKYFHMARNPALNNRNSKATEIMAKRRRSRWRVRKMLWMYQWQVVTQTAACPSVSFDAVVKEGWIIHGKLEHLKVSVMQSSDNSNHLTSSSLTSLKFFLFIPDKDQMRALSIISVHKGQFKH